MKALIKDFKGFALSGNVVDLRSVKGLMRVGMNFRAQGNRECDYCKEFIPVDASRCKFCTSEIEPVVPD